MGVTILLGVLLTAVSAAAPLDTRPPSAPARTPVFLQFDAPDAIGAMYVAQLRGALERASAYRPVVDPGSARYLVGVVTMDPFEAQLVPDSGRATVAAVTLQRGNSRGLNQFVYSWVYIVKPANVDALVEELVAAIDREIRDLEPPSNGPGK